MNNEIAKRIIGAAQRFRQEVKEAAKELDDEDFRKNVEKLGDTVVETTKSAIAVMETLSLLLDNVKEKSKVEK